MRALPLLAVALLAAGCPKPNGDPPADCSADGDCKSDERCVGGGCRKAACADHPCHAGQGCVDGECRAADCLEVACAAGQGCAMGKCFPLACDARTCAPGDVCVNGACVFAGCAEKPCAKDAVCADGRCFAATCASQTCADGAACVEGACRALPCVGVTCPDGQSCAAGRCVPAACGATACEAGRACVDGKCADPACAGGLACAAGTRCEGAACAACQAHELACGDGLDDDCDGMLDCADPDCDAQECAAGKACKAGACADEPCGNGKKEAGEDCDDGNRKDADGCSRACKVECGWACDGAPSACTPDDLLALNDKVAPIFGTSAIRAVAVADDGIYLGGDAGKLAHLDRLTCAATDKTAKLGDSWKAAPIVALAWDSAAKVLYLGGANFGRFALYHPPGWLGTDPKHPGADAAFDLSPKHTLTTQPWSVDALAADPAGKAVYLAVNDTTACGPSHLVRYRADADVADIGLNTCTNPCVAPPAACGVTALTLDGPGRILWAAGRGKPWTGFHKLDLASGTFTKCASTSLSNNLPRAIGWDPVGKSLYLTGTVWDSAGGDVVQWEPETATQTNLTSKISTLWGMPNAGDRNDLWGLAVDPVHHVVYVGGNGSRMGRYRTPQNEANPDTALLVALSTTAWGTEAVKAVAYDASGFVWIAGENGRLARLRAKP